MLLKTILFFLIGLIILVLSSNVLITSLVRFSKKVGATKFLVGSIILAVGTSLPEFMNMLISSIQKVPDIGLGDQIGALIANSLLVGGIIMLFSKKQIREPISTKNLLLLIASIGLIFLFLKDKSVSRLEGAILLCLFLAFHIDNLKNINNIRKILLIRNIAYDLLVIPITIFALINSAFLVISTAKSLSLELGIAQAVIGLAIISVGTSLPELITAFLAIKRHQDDVAVGDIFGGNMAMVGFNIPISALLVGMTLSYNFTVPIIVALFSSFFVFLSFKTDAQHRIPFGLLAIGAYTLYILNMLFLKLV